MLKFDSSDKRNKYGETRKERAIWLLLEEGKTLKDADWKVTAEDEAFFEKCKELEDALNVGNTGKRKHYVHFFND